MRLVSKNTDKEAAVYRKKPLFKSIDHIKKINPEKRMELFLDLQQSMYESYWTELKDRFPNASETELKKIALKEAKSRVRH